MANLPLFLTIRVAGQYRDLGTYVQYEALDAARRAASRTGKLIEMLDVTGRLVATYGTRLNVRVS